MPDCLRSLVEMIIRSFPVENPHMKQRQQRWIVNLRLVNHLKPFGPTDHMGLQPIVKEQVWEDIILPPMVCNCLILPLLADSVKGILGDL